VLVELVRTLPAMRPRRSQYFVAFGTEEPPFFATPSMGSHVFARSLRERGVEVDLMAALDLVGYYTDEPRSQRFPVVGMGLLYPRVGNFVAVVGDLSSGSILQRMRLALAQATDLDVRTFRGPSRMPGVMWSDHWSFRQLGYPGVLVTDTAFLRYPWYHTEQDTPDRLDYERMAELVRGLHAVVLDRDVAD
jgi:Zn-dependent M28 family amino/carboxypeptidase